MSNITDTFAMENWTTSSSLMEGNTTAVNEVSKNLIDNSTKLIPIVVEAASYLSYKIGWGVHSYYLPVIICLGLIGNSFSLAIMLLPHNRRIGCCNYIAALAVSDNIMLLNALVYWSVVFPSRPVFLIECNIMAWFFQATPFASMVFLFSMTVDRFLAIRYPLKSRIWCSPRRARITIACTAVIVLIYTLPYFFTSKLIVEARSCIAVRTTDKLSVAYNWVNIFLGSIVPFFGLLGMNAAIIITIKRRGEKFKGPQTSSSDFSSEMKSKKSGIDNSGFDNVDEPNGSSDQNEKREKTETKDAKPQNSKMTSKNSRTARDNQLTVMLLLVTFTFLALTLPQYARYLVAVLWNYGTNAEDYAYYIMIAHLTNKLFYTNNACNFFLYCLSGSKFRQDFLSLFREKK